MKRLVLALLVVACDGLPTRPDEAKFRAMSDDEQCRATASRAILCTDELLVGQIRSLGLEGGMADEMEKELAKDVRPPKQTRKQNIQVHKTSCAAEPGYVDAVFTCWDKPDCKTFATCVMENSSRKRRPDASPSPSGSATPTAP